MRPSTGRLDRRPSTGKSVRFSRSRGAQVEEDSDLEDAASSRQERENMIRKLENPHQAFDSEDDSLPVENNLMRGAAPPTYPTSAPPPYDQLEDERTDEEDEGEEGDGHEHDINSPKEKRGSVQEVMNKLAQPFNAMLKPMADDSEDEESRLDSLNDEEQWVLDILTSSDLRLENITVKPQLQAFVVDYIPAIGDIDAFIKIPRPDEVEDNAGLTWLDEPAAKQSDPTILDMQMRSAAKELTTQEDAPVKKLTRADQNKDEINHWITNIKELHKSRAPPSVNFKGPMPDIEKLMQEWPQEFEKRLSAIKLPTADLDCSLDEYTDLCCNLADIPVGNSRIHSLYQFFSLYAQFKNSQHFKNLDHNRAQNSRDTTERLEL